MRLPDVPAGIEKRADAAFAEFCAALDAVQAEYIKTYRIYWQGLPSAPTPKDGADAAHDHGKRPTDQAETYADVALTCPAHSPCAFGCDVMEGPTGKAYEAFAVIEIAGKTWRRTAKTAWTEQTELR